MNELKPLDNIPALPARPTSAHKGTFGTVIVVGGSHAMVGAPALCATAALRAGAGLCKIVAHADLLPHILTIAPSATGIVRGRSASATMRAIEEADPTTSAVLAVGPGLGRDSDSGDLVQALMDNPRPMVLDADGLNLMADRKIHMTRRSALVLTPHPGEYRRLAVALGIEADPISPDGRADAAAQMARATTAVVLLKGRGTVVSEGAHAYVNGTGNPALATAGSGDVLTGLIAAFLAQNLAPLDAAVLGAYIHGRAADLWAANHGSAGLLAMDLAHLLPDVMHEMRSARSESKRRRAAQEI